MQQSQFMPIVNSCDLIEYLVHRLLGRSCALGLNYKVALFIFICILCIRLVRLEGIVFVGLTYTFLVLADCWGVRCDR